MIRLLIQSGDPALETLLAITLGDSYQVRVESDAAKVKAAIGREGVDVLILDLTENATPLDEALAYISLLQSHRVPIVAMTDDDRRSTALALVEHGVYDYFRKPPHLLELKLVIRRAYEQAQLRRKLDEAKKQLRDLTSCDGLIGASGQMRLVYDLIRRVSDLNAFVLIQGESGTGKELVARAIHNLSNRARSPFVAVSCGAIPETLIEVELFGHDKGAFTGAAGAREGYLEQAEDGTLFLDEIGELGQATQVKLLRVLQQKEFCHLGGTKIIPLRARVLFATNRDLWQMVKDGTFRQDLYYRVNVLKIEVPPLRERQEDIPTLANYFLDRYAASYQKQVRQIRPSAMSLITHYDWPGNVRELENVIQRAVILAESDTVEPENLPEPLYETPALELQDFHDNSFEEQLRGYKVKLVHQAVQACNGNKTLAARRLSITRAYLHRLLRQAEESEVA